MKKKKYQRKKEMEFLAVNCIRTSFRSLKSEVWFSAIVIEDEQIYEKKYTESFICMKTSGSTSQFF